MKCMNKYRITKPARLIGIKNIILTLVVLFVPLSFVEAQDRDKDIYFNEEVFCIDTITIKNPILLEYKYKYKCPTKRKKIFGKLFYYAKQHMPEYFKTSSQEPAK